MTIEIRFADRGEAGSLLKPLLTHVGAALAPERAERFTAAPELDVNIGAYENGAVVAGMGSFSFSMMMPSAGETIPVPIAGLTAVGVYPTHRRRGVLSGMMRLYFDNMRRRGQSMSALFASEGSIYGRFGYGMASITFNADIERDRSAFRKEAAPETRHRLVGEEEAFAICPPIWEKACRSTPGMLSRSEVWWRSRRLNDPDWSRGGRGELQRIVVEQGGAPVAYALYRHLAGPDSPPLVGTITVTEAIGATAQGTRALWRYLCDIDLVSSVRAQILPVDHPLVFLAMEPRRLRLTVSDGLWLRIVDVEKALSARGYPPSDPLVIEVKDAFCPWNEGRYRLEDGVAKRTDAAPDLALDVEALGSLYLGAFPCSQLAAAGRIAEHRAGAVRRADHLFRSSRAPWCPEMF